VRTGRNGSSHERVTKPWTACWSALLVLCVLLLAPSGARAEDDRDGTLDAQPADFQTIDAYVTAQMRAMHIPGVALGVVRGTRSFTSVGSAWPTPTVAR